MRFGKLIVLSVRTTVLTFAIRTDRIRTKEFIIMTVDSLIDLKYKNLKSIIDYIRFRDSSTKREVARELNLSFATCLLYTSRCV